MTSLDPSRSPPPSRLARGLALLALAAPVPSLVGWLVGSVTFVDPLAAFAPERVWGAMLMALAALGMLAKLYRRRRLARQLALASAGITLIGVVGTLLGLALPLDALAAARVGLPLEATTRAVPLSIGALFLLGTGSLYLLASDPPTDRWVQTAGVLAATQLAAAGVLLVSQLAGLLEPAGDPSWRASLPGLLAAMCLGGALLLRAAAREHRGLAPPRWAPVLAGMSTVLAVLVLWRALTARERAQARSRDAIALAALDRAVHRQHDVVNRALGRLAIYLETAVSRQDPVWEASVPRLIDETDGLAGLVWTDSTGRLLRTVPASVLDRSAGESLRRFVAGAPAGGAPEDTSVAGHATVLDGSWRGALWSRVRSPWAGTTYLFALVDDAQLLRIFTADASPRVAIRVVDGDSVVLAVGTVGTDALVRPLRIGTRTLNVALSSADPVPKSPLPDVVLAMGLAVAGLLAITLGQQRRIWEQARAEGMMRMQQALERATDGIWELDVPRTAIVRSPTLLRSLGLDAAVPESPLATWMARIHPDDVAEVSGAIDRHLAGETDAVACAYRVLAGDGTWHTLVDRGRIVERDATGQAVRVLGISADVTERTRAEAALEESERRFRAMFETAYQVELLLDLDGTILEANRAAGALAGTEAEPLRGVAFAAAPWWASETGLAELVHARVERARAGELQRFEVELGAGREQPITVDFSLKPIRDAEGRVVQVLAEGRDLTIRKRAEASLREISTLTTMGQLAARVAHEINNPLAGIQNAFLLIRGAIPPEHPHVGFVGAIEREIDRIAAVTRQLYETYRPDAVMARQASVVIAVSDAVRFLEQVNRGQPVRIVTDVSGAPSMVPVPDALLRQALYTLVQNAVDVSPPQATVTVTARLEADACVLTVADEGPGIPPGLRERIFDPFFSTKDRTTKTGGMGIGLALVRQSVLAVGGRIAVRARAAGGSEFEVRLPMTPLDTGALR